jgi:predicted membrane metal-binding protein
MLLCRFILTKHFLFEIEMVLKLNFHAIDMSLLSINAYHFIDFSIYSLIFPILFTPLLIFILWENCRS